MKEGRRRGGIERREKENNEIIEREERIEEKRMRRE